MTNQDKKTTTKHELSFSIKALIFFSTILFIAAIIRLLTPPEKKVVESEFVTKNYDKTISSFKKVTWLDTNKTIPEKLLLYQQSNEINLVDYLVNELKNQYALVPLEKANNYWMGEEASLNFNVYDKVFVFITFKETTIDDGPQIIKDEAIQKCLDFFKQYNLDLKLFAKTDEIIYLSSEHDHQEVSPVDADSLIIPFGYRVGDFELMQQNENNPAFSCLINKNYEVGKLVFKEKFYQFEPTLEMNTISLDQAVKNIEKGKASIIYATIGQPERLDLNWIETADLTDFEIEYRFDETTKVAYPFFKFEAAITNSSGVTMQAIIITPAVNTQAEKN